MRGDYIPVKELLVAWRERYQRLSFKDKALGGFLVVALWAGQCACFFGMNFWLFAFDGNPAAHSTFVTIWVPALVWFVGYFIPAMVYRWCFVPSGETWGFAFSKRSLLLLAFIGFGDSLGGLTCLYSAKWTPIFLQTMLGATSPMWTFLLTKLLFRQRARPFTRYPAIAFLLVFVGIIVSAHSEFEHIPTNNLASRICWSIINLIGFIIPQAYGVIQGRYVHEYKDQSSSIASTRMIVLVGDTSWQLLFTTLYFPLDAVPWFGSAPYSIDASWTGFTEAIDCIFHCRYNALYMLIYLGGFYVAHIIGVVMNHYSPTLFSVVGLVCGPINALLIILFPVLRISGTSGTWYWDLICLGCIMASCLLFSVWEEAIRYMDDIKKEEVHLLPAACSSSDEESIESQVKQLQ